MEEYQKDNQVEGTVSSIIYQNEENGYTILRLDVKGEEMTVVGPMPGVSPGEYLAVKGRWVRHATYGVQLRAETVERRLPQGLKEIYHYLASGAVKGVGKATARLLIEEFGEDTLTVLEEHPEQLTRIRGISPKRARQIGDTFRQQMGMRLLMEFLTAHQLPLELAVPLRRAYGDVALEVLKANPYLLVGEEFGVEFSQADALALDQGVGAEDPQRLEAGLLFELAHNLNNGHTFLPRRKLVEATGVLLEVSGELLEESLEALERRGEVECQTVAGQEAVYLPALFEAETFIAQRMREMCQSELTPPQGLDKLIDQIQRRQHITYAPQQRQAVELAAQCQVMLLTGGPGTGKTTCLRGVLALFDEMGLETALAAPTGRAAKRLGELCSTEASTIHRLLETGFDPHTGRLVFTHDAYDPLPADAVIVDETSMVDVPLMAALLTALRGDCRLVLVGDPDQLPSVGPGNLFADLIRSKVVPTVRLTEIFRQAAQSAIVRNAHMVNHGELPNLRQNTGDFFFLARREGKGVVDTIVDLCRRRLPERLGIPADQIQVLSPTRRRGTGTRALNQALQQALNPPLEGKGERRFGDWVFRAGDRVMQVKNNYDILWREEGGTRSGMGMFNGDIGDIRSIDGEVITVDFDGKIVEYSPDMLGELEPAFAVTVHKAQGSEYRAVILAALDGGPMLMSRGVLYTAITRARELFIIVGDDQTVASMVANNRQTRRYSGLRARLAEEE
ncbi:ATP-dependent RecD-like DNA helicase [Pseudoflavonifractor sp. AF19-9AC]|uniref:SF1B family DNA helicase RecD2 n=1 Tax=Pseudoflavonifractor sp. AF19-9AC TaxID=2292244 RepID=UPI000E53445A|nr:ATP-dependent RecD-like DNA helicase [Pseudoflavonifractor sp. AF19-9AC]RHR10905.1 ATP-dependent RecD-like DNA helicase [Pseudoflavonifractor sp. AF19-9AC]